MSFDICVAELEVPRRRWDGEVVLGTEGVAEEHLDDTVASKSIGRFGFEQRMRTGPSLGEQLASIQQHLSQ